MKLWVYIYTCYMHPSWALYIPSASKISADRPMKAGGATDARASGLSGLWAGWELTVMKTGGYICGFPNFLEL